MKRRRALAVLAAAGALVAMPARAFRLETVEWRGIALGAPARLIVHHEDRAQALALLDECEAEVARLEAIFSLYRPDSALSRLNRQGELAAPPLDLLALLAVADRVWRASGGAFDASVQPLWELYAGHFGRPGADPAGPPAEAIERARAAIGWQRVRVTPDAITLQPGMGLTLNGIAQGYVTDRIADLLRRRGMRHVLADMGEIAAIGGRGDGTAWTAGLPDGSRRMLADDALAISMADGTRFSPTCHHLFDPHSGRPAHDAGLVAVETTTATLADAISTAVAASGGRLSARALAARL